MPSKNSAHVAKAVLQRSRQAHRTWPSLGNICIKWFTTEETLLREAAVWTRARILSPILQAGGGREILWSGPAADSWKLAVSPQQRHQTPPLRNQAGPGLRRTELCLLIRLLGRRGPQTSVRRYSRRSSLYASRLKRSPRPPQKRTGFFFNWSSLE